MPIEFDFQTSGQPQPDPYLTEEGLAVMVANTRANLADAIERRLSDMRCPHHDQPAAVMVRAVYDHDIEQMDISYGVDTCCQPFLLRVVQILHRMG